MAEATLPHKHNLSCKHNRNATHINRSPRTPRFDRVDDRGLRGPA